jgi:uncharacterized protein YjbJ (UPF0337 family)
MGWLDKLLGRTKSTAGEAMDSPALRDEGRHQEAAGRAEDTAAKHEDLAQDAREREANERAESDRPAS